MPLSDPEVQHLFSMGATPQDVLAFEQAQDKPVSAPGAPSSASPLAGVEMTPTASVGGGEPAQNQTGASGGGIGDAVGRAIAGDARMIPFANPVLNMLTGKPAYDPGATGAGEIAGDVGSAAGMWAGGLPAALKFLNANAALNAAGIPQAAARMGQAGEAGLDRSLGANLPSKIAGIEGLGTALDMASRAPGALFDVGTEAIPALLAGKAAGLMERPGASEVLPALTKEQLAAQDLQAHGYPVTRSHLIPGDTALKAAVSNPLTSAEGADYKKRLADASKADVTAPLDVGGQTTQQLGESLQEAHQNALAARSKAYRDMLAVADNPRGAAVTGVGELTHAGQAFSDSLDKDVAGKLDGISLTQAKIKALNGEGLTPYDVKAGVNPDDVTAALKFADLASQKQKAASPTQLADLASTFAKREKLFQQGGGSASQSAFLRGAQGKAVDVASDIIKRMDAAGGPAAQPAYPAWEAQRANWAKSADLVRQFEGKLSAPTTRLTGEDMYSQRMTSPEQIFQKHFANAGANKISAYKDFLEKNGQDPALVEQMGKDWLADVGEKAADPVKAIETAWRKMTPEWKKAVYSPETISGMDAALERAALARKPLEVLGTQAKGGSQTAPLRAIQEGGKAALTHGGTTGIAAILGTLAGGTVGGAVGMGTGAALEALGRNRAAAQALEAGRSALETLPPVESIQPKVSRIRQALQSPIPGTPGLPQGLQVPPLIRAALAARALKNAQASEAGQ